MKQNGVWEPFHGILEQPRGGYDRGLLLKGGWEFELQGGFEVAKDPILREAAVYLSLLDTLGVSPEGVVASPETINQILRGAGAHVGWDALDATRHLYP